jgi:hypothetical protein
MHLHLPSSVFPSGLPTKILYAFLFYLLHATTFVIIYRVLHKSVNRKCITVYCSFNGFYKVISPTEIAQTDLHCYLDI